MPTKRSNAQKRSPDKLKSTVKQNATRRVADRDRSKPHPDAGRSQKQRSQGRFPGETPLTGEDRPASRAGGKKQGKTAGK